MYIYKTTNLINNKIYVGQHYSKRKNYIGSGTLLKEEIKKYGKENFYCEILEYCDIKDLDKREKYWIKELDSTNREIGYNITEGGSGVNSEVARLSNFGKKFTDKHKENIKKNHVDVSGDKNPMWGKNHTEESKKLISDKKKSWFKTVGFSEEYIKEKSIKNW